MSYPYYPAPNRRSRSDPWSPPCCNSPRPSPERRYRRPGPGSWPPRSPLPSVSRRRLPFTRPPPPSTPPSSGFEKKKASENRNQPASNGEGRRHPSPLPPVPPLGPEFTTRVRGVFRGLKLTLPAPEEGGSLRCACTHPSLVSEARWSLVASPWTGPWGSGTRGVLRPRRRRERTVPDTPGWSTTRYTEDPSALHSSAQWFGSVPSDETEDPRVDPPGMVYRERATSTPSS